jgi:aspartyl-tRNA(Asn)/glutamyl-tRNA(Gln) amidotransferase subunit C
MSDLSRDDILHVAKLARLELTDDEIARFSTELTAILDYVEQLKGVDVEDVAPTSHTLPLKNVLRDDVVTPAFSPEKIMSGAPDVENNCYKVPPVIKNS